MLLKLIGLLFVGLAIIGAILPVMPTTVFLLVAAACFARSSPYLYNKLLSNKAFGPLIRDWENHKSIPRRAKYTALISIVLAASWSCYILAGKLVWQLSVIVLVLIPIVIIWRLPLSEDCR